MSRLLMEPADRAVTKTLSCYTEEWAALETLAFTHSLKTPFDAVRWLIRADTSPELKKIRALFHAPNKKKA